MTFLEVFHAAGLKAMELGDNGPHPGLMVALDNTCLNCGQFLHLHAGDDNKCLFGPTVFVRNSVAQARYVRHCELRKNRADPPGFWDKEII